MPTKKRYNYRELSKILRNHGLEEKKGRGKGSHKIWYDPKRPTLWTTIVYHGDQHVYSIKSLEAIQRRFFISDEGFWPE